MNVSDEEFAMLDEVVSSIYNRGIKDGSADVKMRVEGAYEKGLEDAWKCANKINDMNAREFEEVFGYTYYAGCMEIVSPSEAMQKIKEYEEHKQDEKSCGTCKYVMRIDCGTYPCNACPRDTLPKWEPKQADEIKEYEERQKQDVPDIDDGNIKVGDEVRIKGSDPVKDDCDYGICTRSLPNVNTIYVMRRDGSSGEENKDEWYRTGRIFPQIAEVLEQLRGEEC